LEVNKEEKGMCLSVISVRSYHDSMRA